MSDAHLQMGLGQVGGSSSEVHPSLTSEFGESLLKSESSSELWGEKGQGGKKVGHVRRHTAWRYSFPFSATSTSASPDSHAGSRGGDVLQPELMSFFCFFCCRYYRTVICNRCYTAEISLFPSDFCCLDLHPQPLHSAPGIKLASRGTWGETPQRSVSSDRPFCTQGCTKMKKGKQQHLQCCNPPRSKAQGSTLNTFHLFPHRFLEIRGML